MSREYQIDYLKRHPGSHKELTGRPQAVIEKEKTQERERRFHVVDGTVHVDLGHDATAIIDRRDYGLIRPYKWSLKDSGGNQYAQAYMDGKVKLMHRIIAEAMSGHPLPTSTDVRHQNGNTLDNRRENLEIS